MRRSISGDSQHYPLQIVGLDVLKGGRERQRLGGCVPPVHFRDTLAGELPSGWSLLANGVPFWVSKWTNPKKRDQTPADLWDLPRVTNEISMSLHKSFCALSTVRKMFMIMS